MNETCDLHTHSVFSDGTWTPEQLVDEAERIGLSAIALTDHNTVDGLPRFLAAGQGKNLETIPGVEFSTDYLDMDIHVVALYVMPKTFSQVSSFMEEGKRKKDQSNRELIENLAKIGLSMDYGEICCRTPGGQVNRAHIAAEMRRRGWVTTNQQAFEQYLEPKCGFYHPCKRPDIFEMIGFIRSIGAVPILAHPFLKLSEQQVREFLPRGRKAGLLGMETEYVSFSREKRDLAAQMAREAGLLQSGGSDFHGDHKPGIFLGVGKGDLSVPIDFRNRIREMARI